MKKLLYLLLLLPLGFITSCSDDDFPDVDVTTTFTGGTFHNDTIYTVVGDTLRITDIYARPVDGTKNAAITNVFMWLNYRPIYPTIPALALQDSPILIADTPGHAYLQVAYNILQVDKSIANFQAEYFITVVPEVSDLPANAPEVGSFSLTTEIRSKK